MKLLLVLAAVAVAASAAQLAAAHAGHHHGQHRHLLEEAGTAARGKLSRCGTETPSPEQVEWFERQLQHFISSNKDLQTAEKYNISIVFHVISDGADGHLTDETLLKQLAVMNEGYKNTPFVFHLGGITRTENVYWLYVRPGSQVEEEMKKTLHQGDATTLNVYTALPSAGWYGTLLGYATFPFGQMSFPKNNPDLQAMDGVVIHYGSVPGGETEGFNLGLTLVHEAGHWLGLYHTFQGGCGDLYGDHVADTPAEGYPSSSCDSRDTCTDPRAPGTDPVNNFMDYSPDACLNEFTPGQVERMKMVWLSTRGYLRGPKSAEATASP